MKVAFIIYEGFSALDLASLSQPLSLLPDLEWQLCAAQTVVSNNLGQSVKADLLNPDLSSYDLIALPGGEIEQNLQDEALLNWLAQANTLPWIAAVNQGSVLLAAAGLLNGKQIAASQENFIALKENGAEPVEASLYEDDAIFSASSSASALELGVMLCAQLGGLGKAEQIRQQLGLKSAKTTQSAPMNSETSKFSDEGLRYALIRRNTNETQISLELDLDGSGEHDINSSLPFLDHMLTQLAVHGFFDLKLEAEGDIEVDAHHTVEDIGRILGQAFKRALGGRKGIQRMSSKFCAMDDSLARVVLDFSGRPYSIIKTEWNAPSLGNIPVTLFDHFLESFSYEAGCNLHVEVLYGKDDHHKAEAIFKAFAKALDEATQIEERRKGTVPSSKGILD